MATKKSTAPARKAGALPDGYKVIENAPHWDIEKDPIITGMRGATQEVVLNRGGEDERDARNFTLQDDIIGEVVVWESANLRNLFDRTNDGDSVRIEFLGFGEARDADSSPPKLFSCAVKSVGTKAKGGKSSRW